MRTSFLYNIFYNLTLHCLPNFFTKKILSLIAMSKKRISIIFLGKKIATDVGMQINFLILVEGTEGVVADKRHRFVFFFYFNIFH